MPLVSSSIPNLINGVSQQPSALRLASQAEQVVNCLPSPVEGLKKRPPCQHIAKLITGSAGATRPFVRIVDRDGANRYLILILDNDIRVFGLDGTEKTVNKPDGTGYLNITNTLEPSATFRMAAVADFTFIANREKTVTMLTGGGNLSPVWGTKGMVFIRSAEYSTTYKIKVNSTEVSETTRPAGGDTYSASYSQSGTTVTVTSDNHGWQTGYEVNFSVITGDALNGKFAITVTGANTFTFTASNSDTTSGNCSVNYNPLPSTVDIATNLAASLSTALGAGFTVTSTDYVVRITKNDGTDYTLASSDTRSGQNTVPIKGTVDTLADLPTIAEHGFILKVLGSQSTSLDDYYVKFEANAGSGFGSGRWRETVAPGIQYKFDPATMPHVLVDNNDGTFTFRKFDWSPRVAGDATTAPNPTFVGSKINNLTLFRNRLVLLADENVIMSAADSYDRFWPETVQTVVDSDPIDLNSGGTQVNILLSAIPFASTLLLFSRHTQFRLDAGGNIGQSLTPKTANITAITTFDMNEAVDPVAAGRTIYFPIPRGDFSGIREYFLPEATSPIPISEEITASVPRFIPKNLSTLIGTVSEEALVAISKDNPRRLYLYKFFFQDDTKLQSAWSYWEVTGSKTIIGADFLDSDLYLVVQYSDGVYLEQVVIRPENVDAGLPFEMLLDRKVSEAACTVTVTSPSGLDVQSTITLPYPVNPGSDMVVTGRGDGSADVLLEDSGGFLLEDGGTLITEGGGTRLGQVIRPVAVGSNTLTVRGDLTNGQFWVGELYNMLYEFSTQYLKEQPPGGGMAVVAGPKLQLRTWTMIFDQSSSFQVNVTPRNRDTYHYPYNGIEVGDQSVLIGEPGIRTDRFRVPVLTQNIDAQITVTSDSPLPCRLQSAEWEGWYHARARRL
jgi:hypothetical protein